MITVGITGSLGAGKSTVARHLKDRGLAHYSARDFIIAEIERRGLPVSHDTTVSIGNDLRERFGPDYVIRSLHEQALSNGRNAVIESVRVVGEVEYLRTDNGFFLLCVDAEPRVRYERIKARGSSHDHISFEQFLEHEARERHSEEPHKQSIADVMKHADFTISNSGSIEALGVSVDRLMARLLDYDIDRDAGVIHLTG